MSEALISRYYDKDAIDAEVAGGHHREMIGGMWDEIGYLQFEFMVQTARLLRHHKLLDLGCGSLRGGVRFVPYLDVGNYFGFDINQSLMDAGYDREIVPAGLAPRLPRSNLIADDNFDFSAFPVQFDKVIALSVFTHLTLNMIRVCLERLAPVVKPGGEFYATYFTVPHNFQMHKPLQHRPGDITTYGFKDPYHYRWKDLHYAAEGTPWKVANIGAFNHPRDQHMAVFKRV